MCWSRSTGKPLCNAIVWDDARTNAVVRQFEKKLDEEGIEIDDDGEEEVRQSGAQPNGHAAEGVVMGTGAAESAFAEAGEVEKDGDGVVGAVGKVMENLGFAGRGKEHSNKKRRKGKAGLVDM